jgi:hypothetical protein
MPAEEVDDVVGVSPMIPSPTGAPDGPEVDFSYMVMRICSSWTKQMEVMARLTYLRM